MGRHRWIGVAAFGLVAVVLAMRLCRRPSAPPPPPGMPIEIPRPDPPPPLPGPPRVTLAPPPAEAPRRDLAPWLERLGRARLLRDTKTLERLRGEIPPLLESDVPWLLDQLRAELFTAAGAAELARWYRLSRAAPVLSEILLRPVHPFLKGIVIDALERLEGDAAALGLLAGLRLDSDPGVRARCAAALGSSGSAEAYHALVAALRDPVPAIRSAAADALRRLKSRQAVEILMDALLAERDPEVQADLAMNAYAAGGEAALPSLRRLLREYEEAAALLRYRARLRGEARYARPYLPREFEPGQPAVPWDPSARKIGITVELGEGVRLPDVADAIFAAAPFDRYRAWFRFRRAGEFPSERVYDSYGNPAGEVPYDRLDGTVYLHFQGSESFKPGVLGFAEGSRAFVQPVSLLHELGHAFARLGDEYAGGSQGEAPNLRRTPSVPWQPLVVAGHLEPPVEREEGFFIPSGECHLGNRLDASRFCPVCQLEIVARISDLAGAPLPW